MKRSKYKHPKKNAAGFASGVFVLADERPKSACGLGRAAAGQKAHDADAGQ
jgi:hypothetical protein